ncbi:MAG: SGNH/GDSL hydrolase family protein [Limisphaerales bacterium]
MDATKTELTTARQRVIAAYRTAGIITLNTVLLLVLVNVVMAVLGLPRDKAIDDLGRRVLNQYGEERLLKAYPDWTLTDLRQLHQECWGNELVYDSFAGYKELPREGKFVNVDINGFRHIKDQAVWPPDTNNLNIFVFGGSTTFGYGLPDHETIPSFLQQLLREEEQPKPAAVYNFGRAYYYSSQERVLFEKLLIAGFRPDIAIFIDGLNEVLTPDDTPINPHWLRDQPTETLINRLPLIRLVNQLAPQDTPRPAAVPKGIPTILSQDPVEVVCLRYLHNQDLLRSAAKLHEVQVLFVWQPIPDYHPNAAAHPYWQRDDQSQEAAAYHYLEPRLTGENNPKDFLWAADLQEGRKQILYVDEVHYSAAFSKIIAEAISSVLNAGE